MSKSIKDFNEKQLLAAYDKECEAILERCSKDVAMIIKEVKANKQLNAIADEVIHKGYIVPFR